MLEHIGEDTDANFNLKPDKINDKNYNEALNCLRKHLHIIECVLFCVILFLIATYVSYIDIVSSIIAVSSIICRAQISL